MRAVLKSDLCGSLSFAKTEGMREGIPPSRSGKGKVPSLKGFFFREGRGEGYHFFREGTFLRIPGKGGKERSLFLSMEILPLSFFVPSLYIWTGEWLK